MRSFKPRESFRVQRDEMDRLLDRLMGEERRDVPSLGEWKPPLDLKETEDNIIVTAEVPGVDPKQVRIEVGSEMVILEGQKQHEMEWEHERFHRMERSYGSFSRAVMLPAPVDAAKGTASFKNGVIVITMPKARAARQTTIPVNIE
jgi:HSP20 family protein